MECLQTQKAVKFSDFFITNHYHSELKKKKSERHQ